MMLENGSNKVADSGLRLNNTLCGCKKPFFTSDGSRRITWYICGPTVYDSSHVGHARNYLTFDIIRRVLEGYFNYHVFYVMNVTDVDDKIIYRARRNYLLDQFLKTTDDTQKVLCELKTAFEKEKRKQEKKMEEVQMELSNASSTRQRQELDDKLKQEMLKLEKLNEAFATVQGKEGKVSDLEGKEWIEFLLADGAADVLASHLDENGKATVTDLAIFRAHAAKYEKDFLYDMQLLGVKPPDVLTRVTEYIDIIIEFIKKIVDKGLAYVANNSVYFDTKAFMDAGHTYGKLNPWAVGSLGLASESESDFQTSEKKNSIDFALWKASKPGEPFWESPWGLGRPGWHIECSAMASEIIGSVIDIHSGGQDLMFPHHDNELAQAEAYHDCSQWVNFFLHSGHLAIEGLKMSKSLKNFITIKEALKTYTARQLRLLFINQAWDKPLHFSESAMKEAIVKERTLQNFFKIVKNFLRKTSLEGDSYSEGFEGPQRLGDEEKHLLHALQEAESEVQERLEDNIDTARALLALLNLASTVNSYVDKMVNGSPRAILVRKAAEFITRMLVIFGVSNASESEIGFGSQSAASSGNLEAIVTPYVDAAAVFRDDIRAAVREGASKERILDIADRFRDFAMVDIGVRLEDTSSGSNWELEDAEILRKLRDEKIQKEREAKISSLCSKWERKVKDLDRYKAALANPKDLFINQKHIYSVFDERGVPTHDAEGKEISKSAKKDAEKKIKKAEEEHEKFKRKFASDPSEIDRLTTEIAELQKQIDELSQ